MTDFTYGHGRMYGPARATLDVGHPATTDGRYDEHQLAMLATFQAREEHARVMSWRGRRIALLACSARKGLSPQPALTLYRGDLFKLGVAWARRHGYEIWILSAKHGLISAETVIAPYNVKLREKTLGAWSGRVDSQFRTLGMYLGDELVILAGDLYRRWLECRVDRGRLSNVAFPLRGMGIGEQKAWLAASAGHNEQRELFAA